MTKWDLSQEYKGDSTYREQSTQYCYHILQIKDKPHDHLNRCGEKHLTKNSTLLHDKTT